MSEPIKRPTAVDTEDDLLRFQAEFMKNKANVKKDVVDLNEGTTSGHLPEGAGSVNRKRKIVKEPSSDDREVYETLENKSDLVSILTNICELDISNHLITTPSATPRGFPCVKDFSPVEDGESKLGTRKKKSLFARQYDKKHQFVPRTTREVAGTSAVQSATSSSFLENVLPCERMAIEDQTNKILNQMTEQEKRDQAEKIFKTMDPKLVEFLKKRKREAHEKQEAEKNNEFQCSSKSNDSGVVQVSQVESMDAEKHGSCCHKDDFLHPDKKEVEIEGEAVEIPVYVKPGHHPNMGVLEPEKMQWMSEAKKTASATTPDHKDKKEEVRFDFDGKIVPRDTAVHPDRGLHHHGEDPTQAGYTLDELFILSRSVVVRQRQIALETLVHVTQRARHGMFTKYVKQPMLQLLLDSGVVQLYRHALDTSEFELALQGLAALLLSPTEVFIQDELYPALSLYTLQPNTDITKDMDHDTVLALDVVRLLVDSQLPQRFWYLLSKHDVTRTLVDNILNVVLHLSQHSLHAAMVMIKHGILLEKLVELFLPIDLNHFMSCEKEACVALHPSHIVIKILRVLSSHSKTITENLLSSYNLDSTIKMFLSLNHKDFKGGEMLRCQVESARLWEVMLRWGMGASVFSAVFPLLVRELASGGQCSVKLTTATVRALTAGLHVFPWQDVGAVYHPILANILTWAQRPHSERELPPCDDIVLITTVFGFLGSFIKLHHSKHFDINLINQVSDLVDKLVAPVVTGTMFDSALSFMIHCKSFLLKDSLRIESLPTLNLHQYYKRADTRSDKQTTSQTDMQLGDQADSQIETLDLCTLSSAGEQLIVFFACSQFVRQISTFLSTAFNINKELSEVVTGFLEKCSNLSLLDRHRQYKDGKLISNIPDLVFHGVTLMQYEYLLLSHKVLKKGGKLPDILGNSLLQSGVGVVAELRSGHEYQQFNLISGFLFDRHVNKKCHSCGTIFMKSFEAAVSRDSAMKSQEYWNTSCDGTKLTSLFLGKLAADSRVKTTFVFLSDDIVTSLPEPTLLDYLTFLEHLLPGLQSVPVCVQLIYIMKIFMLPSRPFLQPNVSQVLQKFLDHFSKLPSIDFRESKLSGYPSFYDFYNTFCNSYEAEGFCDPIFAGFVLIPTRCDYAMTYRRLIWVERIETLRLLRKANILLHRTLLAPESDADLMTIYVTALKNGITGLPKLIALHHVVRFFTDDKVIKDDKLLNVMLKYVSLCSDDVKEQLLKFERINEFNEVVFYEKAPAERREKLIIH